MYIQEKQIKRSNIVYIVKVRIDAAKINQFIRP